MWRLLLSFTQFSDEYRKINEQCQVPTLIIDGHTLTQSVRNHRHAYFSLENSSGNWLLIASYHWVPWWDQTITTHPSKRWCLQACHRMPLYCLVWLQCWDVMIGAGSSRLWVHCMWHTTHPGEVNIAMFVQYLWLDLFGCYRIWLCSSIWEIRRQSGENTGLTEDSSVGCCPMQSVFQGEWEGRLFDFTTLILQLSKVHGDLMLLSFPIFCIAFL